MRASHSTPVVSMTRLLLLVVIAVFAAAAGCSSGAEETPVGPQGPIFSFPYIFKGNFTVAGQPGPQGVPMFARLGSTHGIVNDTIRVGEYTNIIIAPERSEDAGGMITFHLGDPDGDSVQADQTLRFNLLGEPQLATLNLSFPRLP